MEFEECKIMEKCLVLKKLYGDLLEVNKNVLYQINELHARNSEFINEGKVFLDFLFFFDCPQKFWENNVQLFFYQNKQKLHDSLWRFLCDLF
jgi:hypothetical protein